MQQVLRYSYKYQKHYIAKVHSHVLHDEWISKFHIRMEQITDNKKTEYYIQFSKLYYGREELIASRSFYYVDHFLNMWSAISQLSRIYEAIKRKEVK